MNMVVSHWSANVAILAVCLVIAAVHAAGVRGMVADARQADGAAPDGAAPVDPVREVVAFDAGLVAILLALVSPLAYWSREFIWVRSLQDILLAVVAPPLIVLAAPWLPLRRGLSGRRRRGLGFRPDGPRRVTGAEAAGPSVAESAAGRPAVAPPAAAGPAATGSSATWPGAGARRPAHNWRSWPVVVTAAFTVTWCGWHVPVLYDGAHRYPVVFAAEVVSYLGVGTAFWLQLIGSRPLTPRLPPLPRVMLIGATVITSTILGMVLGFGANVIYPAYRGAGHHLLTVVADQQVGGAILWVLVLPSYIIAGVALLVRWLNEEESEAVALGFDRLLQPPKSAWPSRPGLR
jgi:putative membrane protein